MRHLKHRHQLGVKKEHRQAIMASLTSALFRHDRIQTTIGYAKALRPFAEKVITLAKKAYLTSLAAVSTLCPLCSAYAGTSRLHTKSSTPRRFATSRQNCSSRSASSPLII